MTENHDLALDQLQATLAAMPPVSAMQIRIAGYNGRVLRLQAPLQCNLNDKGNAFGGSLASLMTLAGWALTQLQVNLAGRKADVYVADSTIRYRAPVYGDLHASAQAASGQDWDEFLDTLHKRGRARIVLHALIGEGAAELEGRFVAIAKD